VKRISSHLGVKARSGYGKGMNTPQRLARPMLASMFVVGGLDAVRNSESKVKSAAAVTEPLTRIAPWLPEDPEFLVKVNGAVQVGAGVLLATGKFKRLASLALIGSIIPTTYAGHRFWEEPDDARRAQQRTHFLKNLGLLGGLILQASEPRSTKVVRQKAHRNPRVGRSNHARAAASAAGVKAASSARKSARHARRVAGQTSKEAANLVAELAERSHDAASIAGRHVTSATDHAGHLISQAQDQLAHLRAS
jgi:putative oxidoreductase